MIPKNHIAPKLIPIIIIPVGAERPVKAAARIIINKNGNPAPKKSPKLAVKFKKLPMPVVSPNETKLNNAFEPPNEGAVGSIGGILGSIHATTTSNNGSTGNNS